MSVFNRQLMPIRHNHMPSDRTANLLMLRGSLVWSFAEIEQMIIEVAIRTSYFDAYAGMQDSAPQSFRERLDYLKKMLDREGPLNRFHSLGLAIIARYESSQPLRNQMAHDRMKAVAQRPVKFSGIFVEKRGITERPAEYTDGTLESLARKIALFARALQKLKYRLEHDHNLPSFSEGEANLRDNGEIL